MKDHVSSMRWVVDIEATFHMSYYLQESKVNYVASLLRDATKDWRKLVGNTCSPAKVAFLNWLEFSILFKEEFIPIVEVQRLTKEFVALRQVRESE